MSISGFALNYATPFGLMGGEPYRIMELTPVLGGQRATSSVILYVMMHIFTHICFWLGSTILCLFVCRLTIPLAVLLALVGVFCGTAIWFFMQGYKKGMVVKLFRLLEHIPIVGKRAARFHEKKRDSNHSHLLSRKLWRYDYYMIHLYICPTRFMT